MDVEKILTGVEGLSEYIAVTQDVTTKYKSSKIQFNMSTVLSVKKIRFLEIEYFNKCGEHGAAFIILERVLELPGSKTWGLLGKELVALLQHWLDSLRKHLIVLNESWWSFMHMLLKFIKELRLKDATLPDLLVEGTAEQLLDVATRREPDVLQRQHILYCLNLCCADSSREVRFATRNRLDVYFVKLSALLATSAHAPTQFAILETLLRWLLPRQNPSVRQAAASKWFPDNQFRKQVVDIFLERPWHNFPQDARDFLNAHNQTKNLVTSVVFRRMAIGDVTVDCSDRRESWLDINSANKSITVLLDGRMMQALAVTGATLQSLVLAEDAMSMLRLAREASDLVLLIKTSRPVQVYPSEQSLGDGADVAFIISSRNDLKRLDNALRAVFGDKYEIPLDIEALTSTSPLRRNIRIADSSEEDTRFSHPVRPSRRKASGYVTKSAGTTFNSPSTTSTTSLALLQDRLKALPKFRFNKEPLKISALPDLSNITEIDDSQSIASSTGRNRTFGFYKSFRQSEKQSQSDGEKYKSCDKYISPIIGVKQHDVSCLLVATVGSDEAVINETIDSLQSKTKDDQRDNIVDLLLLEALQSKDDKLDSGIETGENIKKTDLRDSEAIENTPDIELSKSLYNKKQVENDKSEESNEIDDTPFEFVSVRKKVIINKHKQIEEDIQKTLDGDMQAFDEEAVERFFSQHIAENSAGGIAVSPTLARKINESSSEASDNYEDCLVEEDFPNVQAIQDVEIIDCMNNILDKVCHEFEKCAEILEKDHSKLDMSKMAEHKEAGLQDEVEKRILANIENVDTGKRDMETPKKKPKQKKAIKLKFNTKKMLNKTRSQLRGKLEPPSKMSPIPENKDSVEPENVEEQVDLRNDEHVIKDTEFPLKSRKDANRKLIEELEAPVAVTTSGSPENVSPISSDLNMPLGRRRRKLYSPKDHNEKSDIQIESPKKKNAKDVLQEDDRADFRSFSKKTPKSAATCYKDIEKERKKIRLPKSRKSKGKIQARSPSPRTKKMNDIFDNLKANVEENDDIILADKKSTEQDMAIFNFTSDSEDEDFKKKKVDIKKRISTTTNASGDSATSRHGRLYNKVNYSEKSSDEMTKKTKGKNVRRKKTKRRPHNLADQKMRDAHQEELNTSIVILKNSEDVKEPELVLEAPPQMEAIGSELDESSKAVPRKKTIKKKKNVDSSTTKKGVKKLNNDDRINNDDRSSSPLPGLIIEKVAARKEDPNDSVSTQIMNKLKKIYHEGPDAVDDLNTTQNLLVDVDKGDFSQNLNITSEFEKASRDMPNVTERNIKEVKPKLRKNNAILNDKENVIEVITFENQGKENDNNDVVNISISDVQSEISIATVGKSPITAHGDIEEEPPDNKQLIKRVHSRNMGVDDMDTSMKDYYLRLQEEINKPSSSNSSRLEIDLEKSTEKRAQKCISPVMSVHKMSIDDIRKVLSSNSDSGKDKVDLISEHSRKSTPPVALLNKTSIKVIETLKPSQNRPYKPEIDLIEEKSDRSRYSISPVVSLNRMSYDDISKWLPSRRNSYDSLTHSSEKSVRIEKAKSKKDDIENTPFLRPLSKDLHYNVSTVSRNIKEAASSSKSVDKQNVKDDLPKTNSKKIIKLHYDLRSTTKSSSIKRIEMPSLDCNNNDQNSIKTSRKSLISPIKFFDEPENFTNNKRQKSDVISQVSKKPNKIRKRQVKSPVLKSIPSKVDVKRTVDTSSGESRISSSTRVDGKASMRSVLKRKSESPVKEYGKMKRVEVLTESGPSLTSIDDWFKKSAPISAAESLSASYGDSLQNIMEKLDTTLAEIHQNTSKNFLHMFVDAQRRLLELKQERRRVLRQVAAEVVKEVVSALDAKFAHLEQRSQELDSEFMQQLKSRAMEFVREDCKKKRVMVAMLQDDIRAVLRHGDKDSSQ